MRPSYRPIFLTFFFVFYFQIFAFAESNKVMSTARNISNTSSLTTKHIVVSKSMFNTYAFNNKNMVNSTSLVSKTMSVDFQILDKQTYNQSALKRKKLIRRKNKN
ncbi:hypothetical protein [Xanthomarina sp. F2636L]|uniref:hypothetical protein n=1 Tax=Xanthomarina sp. F2636L TaxID=2996018 RepID=UPI00225DD721|nr:hypothetical protein [Xanthomarina sp. F2636L]MCX7551634.1 hypothetical protein [Xanthomarina sp. F2636L]